MKKSRFVTVVVEKTNKKCYQVVMCKRVVYCLRDLPIAIRVCATFMIVHICILSSSLEYKVLMLEYTGCHVLATVVAMYVELYLPLLYAASSDAERRWLPCVGNSSFHVCWTLSAIAICYKF